jgi:hypothetical protein
MGSEQQRTTTTVQYVAVLTRPTLGLGVGTKERSDLGLGSQSHAPVSEKGVITLKFAKAYKSQAIRPGF